MYLNGPFRGLLSHCQMSDLLQFPADAVANSNNHVSVQALWDNLRASIPCARVAGQVGYRDSETGIYGGTYVDEYTFNVALDGRDS